MANNPIDSKVKRFSNLVELDLAYFIGGGFWLSLSTFFSLIGGIFLSALFARIWPKDAYGQFSFLMSALGFMSLTALPGMGQALTQAVAEGKDGSYKIALRAVAKWSMLGVLLLTLGSVYFFFRQNPNLALATFVSALAFPISSATGLSTSFLTGKKNFKKVAIFSIIFQYSSILATALALCILPTLVWVALFSAWSTAIAGIILTLLAYRDIKHDVIDPTTASLGTHLSFSQVFTISADYLDRFLIPLLLGFSNNAVYAFAILIPSQLHTFLKVFLSLGQPKISNISEKRIFHGLWVKALQLEIPIALMVAFYIIIAPIIFKVLYPAYSESATFLSQIFSLGLLYYPGNLFGLGLLKKRKIKSIYIVNITYAVSTAASLLILIPLFGLLGAVLAKLIARIVQYGVQLYLFYEQSKSD